MDAPQLKNNPFGCGIDQTRIDQRGACLSVDAQTGEAVLEGDRIESLMMRR